MSLPSKKRRKDQPDFPLSLLELPRKFKVTTVDFGFKGTLTAVAESARAGNADSKMSAKKALDMFLSLMERDVELRVMRDSKNRPRLDNKGDYVAQERSKWSIKGMEGSLGVGQGNPSAEPDHWQTKVRKYWLDVVLPSLKFFDHIPSADPKNAHTKDLIVRTLDRSDPIRSETLEWLKAFGLETWNDVQDGVGAKPAEKPKKRGRGNWKKDPEKPEPEPEFGEEQVAENDEGLVAVNEEGGDE